MAVELARRLHRTRVESEIKTKHGVTIIPKDAILPPGPEFATLAFIGNGQTSQMQQDIFSKTLPDLPVTVIRRNTPENDTYAVLNSNPPDAIVVTVPEPAKDALDSVAAHLDLTSDNTPTVILSQNANKVVTEAKAAFGENADRINLIRAILLSSASIDGEGLHYNPDKLRIGLAPIPDSKGKITEAEKQALQKTVRLYHEAGYDVLVFDDYKKMELEKAFLNLIGMTGALVGLDPKQTFDDPELYKLELKAWRDRLGILKAAGIDISDIPWGGAPLVPTLDTLPGLAQRSLPVKHFVGKGVVDGRNNKPSSVMLGIRDNKDTEAEYYLRTFIELGEQYGLRSIVDEAMLDLIMKHKKEINLANLSQHKRKRLLFEAVDKLNPLEKKDNPLRLKLGRTFEEFSRNTMSVEIIHPERLDDLEETLKTKSVIVYGNHHGKADGIPYLATMLQVVPPDHIAVVLGMKQYDRIQGPLQKYVQGPLFRAAADAYKAHIVLLMTDEDTHYSKQEKARFNSEASKELDYYLSQPGYVVLIYPEGTRSHNRLLQAGKRGLELLLRKNKDTAVAMPVGSEYHGIFPYGQETRMVLGKPVSYDDISQDLDTSNNLHPELKGSKVLNRTEILMAKLANLVMPRNWSSHYQKIFANYPELENPDPAAGIDRYY